MSLLVYKTLYVKSAFEFATFVLQSCSAQFIGPFELDSLFNPKF